LCEFNIENAVALLFNQNPQDMKTLKFLFLLSILLGLTVAANSQGNQVEKPFKGRFYAVVSESYPAYEILTITGHATHLGIVLNSQMAFVKPTPTTPPYNEGVLKAANGDCIFFYCWPNLVITDPATLSGTMSGTIYISGGTGRFTGCSGECQMSGTFSMGEDWARWTVDGTITY
jgi:hypothetical protein